MNSFPSKMNTSPIPAAIVKRKTFLRIKKKASRQAIQKEFPVIAV